MSLNPLLSCLTGRHCVTDLNARNREEPCGCPLESFTGSVRHTITETVTLKSCPFHRQAIPAFLAAQDKYILKDCDDRVWHSDPTDGGRMFLRNPGFRL
jgi:hypothetical protein